MKPYVIFAMRYGSQAGWQAGSLSASRKDASRLLRQRYPDAAEIRLISHGSAKKSYDGNYAAEQTETMWDSGWMHDVVDRCWRAPGEMPTRPDFRPPLAEFRVQNETAKSGWSGLSLAFGYPAIVSRPLDPERCTVSSTVALSLTDVFDPLPDIKAAAASLANGGQGRFSINQEGAFMHVLIWRLAEDRLHLGLRSAGYAEDFSLDFQLRAEDAVRELENLAAGLAASGW